MKHEKRALVVRYGALGDTIQMTSLLPQLKAAGYHVTVDVNDNQADVIRNDPHIDALIVTPQGKIPLDKLSEFWAMRAIGYDLVVNLQESIEGALLKYPSRPDYYWPDAARRLLCGGHNYVEMQHMVAGLPYDGCRQRFYPTASEYQWAQAYARDNTPLVVWALAGGGPHKVWPWTPSGVARLMAAHPKVHVVLTGDKEMVRLQTDVADSCRMYVGPQIGDRLRLMTGTHTIREVLALAQAAAVVVGPETVTLNAVAMERNRKVVLLSHSTAANLTRDWRNTVAIEPDTTIAPCHPCHRMHYKTDHCPRHQDTNTAVCAASITVERVLAPILEALPPVTAAEVAA